MVLSVDVSELQFLPAKVGADVSYFRSQLEDKYTHTVQSLSLLDLFLHISWWSIFIIYKYPVVLLLNLLKELSFPPPIYLCTF